MLFDIFNYNIPLALSSFIISSLIFSILFRRNITSLVDPLTFHILWLSSQTSFLIIYFAKHNPSPFFYIFALTLLVYIFSLALFLKVYRLQKISRLSALAEHAEVEFLTKKSVKVLLLLTSCLIIYSYTDFFKYAATCSNITELFLYRFVDLQGRDITQRIASSTSPVFFLVVFFGIHKNYYKKICVISLTFFILLGFFAGGRSILLLTMAAAGMYLFYFRQSVHPSTLRLLNKYAVVFAFTAIAVAITITSFYESNSSFESAALVIFNRIFAAPDGVEYYLNYSGHENIKSGPISYFYSIFGIYIKNIIGIEVKNIGWQLTELVVGDVEFAQGSNYTVLLQAVVFSNYLAPIYAVIVAWSVAKLRYIFSVQPTLTPLAYTASSLAFVVATDIEYFVFLLLSFILIFYTIYFPALRARLM